MKIFTIIFIRLFLLTVFTYAQWSSDPSTPQLIGTGIQAQVAPTSDGGIYIAWLTDGNYHVYIQRMDNTGISQFSDFGLLVSDNDNASWIAVYHLNLAVDGNDNAIISTVDQRTGTWEVYAWKISPNGSMLWGDNGIAITSSSTSNMSPRLTIVPDNSVIVTCTHNDNKILFQNISSDGELLWGDGIILEDDTKSLISPQSIINTDGDIIFQWIRQSSGWPIYSEIFIQKFNFNGDPIWADPSLIVGPVSFPMGNFSQQLLTAPNGGVFIAWTELSGNAQNAIAESVSDEGTSLWDGGINLSTNSSNFQMSPMLSIAEGTEELMAIWREANGSQSQHGIFAQRLDSIGNQLWGSTGATVVALNSNYDYLDLSVVEFGEEIISTYIEQSVNMSGDIYAHRMDAEGNSVWTDEMVTLTNSGLPKSDMVVGKGSNCLYITWSENGYVYAHCLREDGTLGTPDQSIEWIFSIGDPVIEVFGDNDQWNPGDTISIEMEFCNETDIGHMYYPGVILESDSSLTSIINYNHFWFYGMDSNSCNTVSFLVFSDSEINSDTIITFSAYPEALNCQNQPEYCIDGDTITFDVSIVLQYASNDISNFIPKDFTLHQNYPNPFNPITTIKYDLPDDALVNITIYNILGDVVNNIVSQKQIYGYKSVQWNATNNIDQPVSAGVYFYSIEAGNFRQTKKMILLK